VKAEMVDSVAVIVQSGHAGEPGTILGAGVAQLH
jgi:hypothetical protein